jgi:large subunit ribosomal protein L4
MLEVQVYNTDGQKVDTLQVDEALFGGTVNISLLKQAIVTARANRRQGTVKTKSRGDVEGSTKKLFAQKHTGNARRGPIRTNVMKGGGMAFAKRPRDYRKAFPKSMRKAALQSAILAKLLGNDLMVVQGLKVEKPKTKYMAGVLKALQVNRRCLLTLAQRDPSLYLSSRNISDVTVRIASELCAFDVANNPQMIVTSEAMQALLNPEAAQ